MKKICLSLVCFMLTFNALAEKFISGQHYITLDKPLIGKPQIIEFFSFFCFPCYQFEEVYHIGTAVKKILPPGLDIIKYHVDFLGGELGQTLTHAWAVAIALGVEDQVSRPLFDGIQKDRTLTDLRSLKEIFVKAAKIKSEDYDAAWNSFTVKAKVVQQQKLAADADLYGVPAIIINGKYMVNNSGLDTSSVDNFIQQYTNVVKFLLEKN